MSTHTAKFKIKSQNCPFSTKCPIASRTTVKIFFFLYKTRANQSIYTHRKKIAIAFDYYRAISKVRFDVVYFTAREVQNESTRFYTMKFALYYVM